MSSLDPFGSVLQSLTDIYSYFLGTGDILIWGYTEIIKKLQTSVHLLYEPSEMQLVMDSVFYLLLWKFRADSVRSYRSRNQSEWEMWLVLMY